MQPPLIRLHQPAIILQPSGPILRASGFLPKSILYVCFPRSHSNEITVPSTDTAYCRPLIIVDAREFLPRVIEYSCWTSLHR